MTIDANSVYADLEGVNPASGDPEMWRACALRHPNGPAAIVGDPTKQAWNSTHNGVNYGCSFSALDAVTAIGDQIAWCWQFSDGIVRDPRFILHELMEDLIARRKAANEPTTSFPGAAQPPAGFTNTPSFTE